MLENTQSTWKKMIKKASREVYVFASYFDDTLVDLLSATKVKKTVVTCIDAKHIYKNPKQITALRKLSKQGTTIRHLRGLETQILLIDRKCIMMGSQGFKEMKKDIDSTVLIEDVEVINKYMSKTISKWIEQSKMIDDFTIDCLVQELNTVEDGIEQQKGILEGMISNILSRTQRKIWIETPKRIVPFKTLFEFEASFEFNYIQQGYLLAYKNQLEVIDRGLTNKIFPILNCRTEKIQFGKLHKTAIFLLTDSVLKKKIPSIFYQLFRGYSIGIELEAKKKVRYDKTNLIIRLIFDTHIIVSIHTQLTRTGFHDMRVESNHSKLKELVDDKLTTFNDLPRQEVMASFFKDPQYFATQASGRYMVQDFLGTTNGTFRIKGVADQQGNTFLTING